MFLEPLFKKVHLNKIFWNRMHI